jgi:recombination protein RecT
MAEQKTAIQVLNNTTMAVQKQIETYCTEGRLNLPTQYSASNALKQLQLKLQDDQNLLSCTQSSIAKCMLDMVILGLNPSKSQCYVINYGGKAQLSVSYMGKIAIAKRIDENIKDIFGRVVKKGDDFQFEDSVDGYTTITKHQRTLESMSSNEILAAYATVVYKDGSPSKSLIMPFERIKKSWAKSAVHPIDNNGNIKAGTTHAQYTDEMAIRTVINAMCKNIINTSNDADLFGETIQSVDLNEAKAQSDAAAAEKTGTGEFIDVDFSDVENTVENVDKETGEILE